MFIAIFFASLGSSICSLILSFLLRRIQSEHEDLPPYRMGKVRHGLSLFLIDLLTFFVFANLMVMLSIHSLLGAWELALWIWGGFTLSTALIISRTERGAWQALTEKLLLRLFSYLVGTSILIFLLS